jgi:NTP pyrophosphatase (non-canonical NTP hydrolase)
MSDIPIKEILDFRDERNWQQFHNPKDLAISLSLEASELLECFQWSKEDLHVNDKKEAMADELADILIYAISFADAIGVDVNTIIKKKLEKNGKKYKIENSYGSSKKYTEFDEKG